MIINWEKFSYDELTWITGQTSWTIHDWRWRNLLSFSSYMTLNSSSVFCLVLVFCVASHPYCVWVILTFDHPLIFMFFQFLFSFFQLFFSCFNVSLSVWFPSHTISALFFWSNDLCVDSDHVTIILIDRVIVIDVVIEIQIAYDFFFPMESTTSSIIAKVNC